jgi:hypothetical protein
MPANSELFQKYIDKLVQGKEAANVRIVAEREGNMKNFETKVRLICCYH